MTTAQVHIIAVEDIDLGIRPPEKGPFHAYIKSRDTIKRIVGETRFGSWVDENGYLYAKSDVTTNRDMMQSWSLRQAARAQDHRATQLGAMDRAVQ